MKTISRAFALLAVVACISSGHAQNSPSPFINGGFEAPGLNGQVYVPLGSPWTVTGAGAAYQIGSVWSSTNGFPQAQEGSQFISVGYNTTVQQTLRCEPPDARFGGGLIS